MVLSEIKKNSGSCYHRLVTPLQSLSDFTEEPLTTVVSNYQTFWTNRNSSISAGTLSIWKEMFDIQIIFDLDDSLQIPKDYPNYNKLIKQTDSVINKMLVADVVIVSTLEIQQELSKLGIDSVYIPNRLPYGKGQFIRKEESWEEFEKRKIQVGLIGSFYHMSDWKEIKGWINSLKSHHLFKEKCEFNICGWHESSKHMWKDIENLGNIKKGLPVDQYINLYKELDIILCPLRDNWFNRCKSSLKVLEAACGNVVCVLDKIYQEKTDVNITGHPFVQKEKDWLNIPLDLISDKKRLFELKNSTADEMYKLDFQSVVDQRKELIGIKKKVELKDQIYSIVYEEIQPSEYIRYFNNIKTIEEKSYLFEYNVILNIKPEKDWVGVFSWKFPLKTGIPKVKVLQILDKYRKSNVQCINFCPKLNQPYLKFTESQHKGFMSIFNPLCKDLGLVVKEPSNVIYSNFFVLRPDVFKEYQKLLTRAITLLETKYKDKVWKNAGYKGLDPKSLKEKTGLDYYTFHTFLLERLISIWIDKINIKSVNYYK